MATLDLTHENKLEELDNRLSVPKSSLRKITITKIEERHEQHRLSSSKYTVYTITCSPPVIDGINISVCRRYNDFKWLRKLFLQCFPSIFIPPIPPQKIIGRFNKKFTLQRQQDLERFLNRICCIKPLSQSLIFIMFLSRPEETFNMSKDEIQQNHIPTIKDKIHFLNKLFPNFAINNKLINEYNNLNVIDLFDKKYSSHSEIIKYIKKADRIIFGEDIDEIHQLLKTICSKISVLCDIVKKINNKLYKLSQDSRTFHESFWRLHSNDNGDTNHTIFGDDKSDFYAWYNYNKSEYDLNDSIFYVHLVYQYQDINAFLDIFMHRNQWLSQFKNVLSRNKNWQNLIDARYDLQPHQLTQIQIDYKQEKLLRGLLLINTKIILGYKLNKIWKDIMNDWKNMCLKYAQNQLLTHQILYAQTYQNDSDDEDNDTDKKQKEDDHILDDDYYQYEPVFYDNDLKQYNHVINNKQSDDNVSQIN